MVVFSVTDKESIKEAAMIMEELWQSGDINTKSIILVGNKSDLVRTRQVPIDGILILLFFSFSLSLSLYVFTVIMVNWRS